MGGKKKDLGVGTEHAHPMCPGERDFTDQVTQRQGRNEHLPRSRQTTRKPTGRGWESEGVGGMGGNEGDRCLGWIRGTGREMPLNCTVEASPVFPGPSLPPPSPDSPDTRAKRDQKDLPMRRRWRITRSNRQCDEAWAPPGLAGHGFAVQAVRRAAAAPLGQAGRWLAFFSFSPRVYDLTGVDFFF